MKKLFLLCVVTSSLNAAPVVLKNNQVCASTDERLNDIYLNILCHNAFRSTDDINLTLKEKYPLEGYTVQDIPYSQYQILTADALFSSQKLQSWEGFAKAGELHKAFMEHLDQLSEEEEIVDLESKRKDEVREYENGKNIGDWSEFPEEIRNVESAQLDFYSTLKESSEAFYTKLNRVMVGEFLLVQDFILEHKAHNETPSDSLERAWKNSQLLTKTSLACWTKGKGKQLLDQLLCKVCTLEGQASKSNKIPCVRFTDGFIAPGDLYAGIDSVNYKAHTIKSLSFGLGLFQALVSGDGKANPLYYYRLRFGYVLPVTQNDQHFFIPNINAIVSLVLSGEFHPRSKLIAELGATYDAFDSAETQKFPDFRPLTPVVLHPDFCLDMNNTSVETMQKFIDAYITNNLGIVHDRDGIAPKYLESQKKAEFKSFVEPEPECRIF